MRDPAGRVSVAQVGVGPAGVEVEGARGRIADVAFAALVAFAYSGSVVGAESVAREVGLVDAFACVALTSAGLAVEGAGLAGAGLAEPCAGQVEGTCVGQVEMSCAERERTCGGLIAAASVGLDELGFARVVGPVVAGAVLEGMVV